jgi:hypothetical protein
MGHITMLGSEVKNILSKAKNIEKKIILWGIKNEKS